jgi:hypothetical protein
LGDWGIGGLGDWEKSRQRRQYGKTNVVYFSYVMRIFVKKPSMTTQDIKKKINKVIDEVPESYLPDILSYLNQLKKSTPKNIDTLQNFRKILIEDRTLLQKLAK